MGSQSRHSAGRFAAAAALTLVGSAAALAGWSGLAVNRRMRLPPALPGRHERLRTRRAGEISLYGSTEAEGVRLLLIHSINAAANAYVLQQDVTGAPRVIDRVNHTITINVNHFSTFVLFNTGAFPPPFVPCAGRSARRNSRGRVMR